MKDQQKDPLQKLRDQLLYLKVMQQEGGGDCEQTHEDADQLLINFINDDEVTRSFMALTRYYA